MQLYDSAHQAAQAAAVQLRMCLMCLADRAEADGTHLVCQLLDSLLLSAGCSLLSLVHGSCQLGLCGLPGGSLLLQQQFPGQLTCHLQHV